MSNILSRWYKEDRNMRREKIIKLQLILHCYMEGIKYTEGEIECMVQLGIEGSVEQARFCEKMCKMGTFSTPSSARNTIGDLYGKGLIVKDGKSTRSKKMLSLAMKIQTEHNILVEIKCLHRDEPKEA